MANFVGIFLGLTAPGRAQFYAPDTECHDRAQRRFVVEFSRILAWRRNLHASGPKVAAVDFTVSLDAERETTWQVRWLDADNQRLHEDTVRYPESALSTGPAWYRDVARQLTQGSPGTGSAATGQNVADSYWQGAESARPSRPDSLRQAFALDPDREPARLAGLLAQAALPSVGYRVSLDGTLLARAAAWLCVAESSFGEPDPSLDALWAPILFLSGREFAAADLWKKSPPATHLPVVQGWNLLLSRPNSQQVFAAAADPQARQWALPSLVYESSLLNLGQLLGPVVGRLFRDERASAPWFDYAAYVDLETSAGGDGRWPALSRAALVQCLREFKPAAADFRGYVDALAKISDPPPAVSYEDADPVLAGWEETAPLINLGYREGVGTLTPVAVVTARDLLNYAWESNGLQMGAHWKVLEFYLGMRDAADAFAETVLGAVDGTEPFFVEHPFNAFNERNPPNAWKHLSRPRLENFARLQEIGGPSIDNAALTFYAYGLTPTGVKLVEGSEKLRVELLAAQTETSYSALEVIKRFDPLPAFDSARRLEKVFWQRPGSDLPYNDVFSDYVRGHAYDAAKRFYTEAQPFLTERVAFSGEIGPRRFTLAMLEGDRAAMQEALAASASGSASDLAMQVMFALEEEDYQALWQLADDFHARYPDNDPKEDMGLKLAGFLPLVSALQDPADPDHAKALDFFKDYRKWPTLQWVFIRNARLSAEEAVRFLGGKDTNLERRLMVAYLLKDKEFFNKTYDDLEASFQKDIHGKTKWSNMAFVVVHWLRNDLFAVPVPAEQPDLKPPGVKSLLQAFTAKDD